MSWYESLTWNNSIKRVLVNSPIMYHVMFSDGHQTWLTEKQFQTFYETYQFKYPNTKIIVQRVNVAPLIKLNMEKKVLSEQMDEGFELITEMDELERIAVEAILQQRDHGLIHKFMQEYLTNDSEREWFLHCLLKASACINYSDGYNDGYDDAY